MTDPRRDFHKALEELMQEAPLPPKSEPVKDLHKELEETKRRADELQSKIDPEREKEKVQPRQPSTPTPETDIHGALEELKEEVKGTLIKTKTTQKVVEQTQAAGLGSVYQTPEYQQYVQSGMEISQAIEDAPEPLQLITRAPEGYYYRGEDVQAYNAKVSEYNNRLRDYKRKLRQAYNEYRAGLITYDSYEVQRKNYEIQVKLYEDELKRTEPQRQEYLEYLKSIGPPEPSKEPPIHGPGGPPKPGSIGAELQERVGGPVSRFLEGTLDIYERPFEAVTDPMREEAQRMGELSQELGLESKALAGFGVYVAGTALRTGAMAFDVATFEIRPGLWADVGRTVSQLAFNPEARTALANEALRDPVGFTAEVAGGAYLGGKLKEIPGETYQAYKMLKAQRGSVTEGIYGVSVKEPSYGDFLKEYQATRAARKAPPIGPLELEQQLAGEVGLSPYPEADVVQRTRFLGFEELKEADTTSNAKFDQLPDAREGVSTETGAYKPPPGKYPPMAYDKKLWRSTGAELELVTVPPETPLMPVYKPIPDVEILPTVKPGIRYSWTEPISAAKVFKLSEVLKSVGLKEISTVEPKIKEIEAMGQIQRPQLTQAPNLKQPTLSKLDIGTIQTPTINEIQEPKISHIQEPRLGLPTLQLPKLDTPQEPGPPRIRIPPYVQPPSTPPRKIIDIEPKKAEKKKPKRGKLGVFEVRVDVKEPKLPDIEKIGAKIFKDVKL